MVFFLQLDTFCLFAWLPDNGSAVRQRSGQRLDGAGYSFLGLCLCLLGNTRQSYAKQKYVMCYRLGRTQCAVYDHCQRGAGRDTWDHSVFVFVYSMKMSALAAILFLLVTPTIINTSNGASSASSKYIPPSSHSIYLSLSHTDSHTQINAVTNRPGATKTSFCKDTAAD